MPEPRESQQEETLFDYYSSLDESTLNGEDAIASYLRKPTTENGVNIGASFTQLAMSIKNILRFIVNDEELAEDEKASMIANVLIADDERRNNFLISLCQPDGEGRFRKGYKDFDTVRSGVEEIISISKEDDFEEDYVDLIMRTHVDFMNTDIHDFITTDVVVEREQKHERRDLLKKQIIKLGGTAVASAIGSGIAVWLLK